MFPTCAPARTPPRRVPPVQLACDASSMLHSHPPPHARPLSPHDSWARLLRLSSDRDFRARHHRSHLVARGRGPAYVSYRMTYRAHAAPVCGVGPSADPLIVSNNRNAVIPFNRSTRHSTVHSVSEWTTPRRTSTTTATYYLLLHVSTADNARRVACAMCPLRSFACFDVTLELTLAHTITNHTEPLSAPNPPRRVSRSTANAESQVSLFPGWDGTATDCGPGTV
jgi:hypothetical protein